MKALLCAITLLFMSHVSVQAQSVDLPRDRSKTYQQKRSDRETYLQFEGGRLYHVEAGRAQMLNDTVVRPGIVFDSRGHYKLFTGLIGYLREGECVDKEGHRYKNLHRFNAYDSLTQRQITRIRKKIHN